MAKSTIDRVTVVGAGVLGGQTAWHSAFKGNTVVVYDPFPQALARRRAAGGSAGCGHGSIASPRAYALGAVGAAALLAIGGFATQNYALSSDQFAVIVKTGPEGCLKYPTLVDADRLAWSLRQIPGV